MPEADIMLRYFHVLKKLKFPENENSNLNTGRDLYIIESNTSFQLNSNAPLGLLD